VLANDCDEMRRVLLDVVREYAPPTALADQVYNAARQMQKRGERTVVELPKRG